MVPVSRWMAASFAMDRADKDNKDNGVGLSLREESFRCRIPPLPTSDFLQSPDCAEIPCSFNSVLAEEEIEC